RWAPARWRRGPASSVRWRLEVDDDGHVIGGAFPFAFIPVDPHPADPLGSGGRGEREIDPHPVVAAARQRLVTPVRALGGGAPAKTSISHTSSSNGATFQSPTNNVGSPAHSRAASASAPSHASL